MTYDQARASADEVKRRQKLTDTVAHTAYITGTLTYEEALRQSEEVASQNATPLSRNVMRLKYFAKDAAGAIGTKAKHIVKSAIESPLAQEIRASKPAQQIHEISRHVGEVKDTLVGAVSSTIGKGVKGLAESTTVQAVAQKAQYLDTKIQNAVFDRDARVARMQMNFELVQKISDLNARLLSTDEEFHINHDQVRDTFADLSPQEYGQTIKQLAALAKDGFIAHAVASQKNPDHQAQRSQHIHIAKAATRIYRILTNDGSKDDAQRDKIQRQKTRSQIKSGSRQIAMRAIAAEAIKRSLLAPVNAFIGSKITETVMEIEPVRHTVEGMRATLGMNPLRHTVDEARAFDQRGLSPDSTILSTAQPPSSLPEVGVPQPVPEPVAQIPDVSAHSPVSPEASTRGAFHKEGIGLGSREEVSAVVENRGGGKVLMKPAHVDTKTPPSPTSLQSPKESLNDILIQKRQFSPGEPDQPNSAWKFYAMTVQANKANLKFTPTQLAQWEAATRTGISLTELQKTRPDLFAPFNTARTPQIHIPRSVPEAQQLSTQAHPSQPKAEPNIHSPQLSPAEPISKTGLSVDKPTPLVPQFPPITPKPDSPTNPQMGSDPYNGAVAAISAASPSSGAEQRSIINVDESTKEESASISSQLKNPIEQVMPVGVNHPDIALRSPIDSSLHSASDTARKPDMVLDRDPTQHIPSDFVPERHTRNPVIPPELWTIGTIKNLLLPAEASASDAQRRIESLTGVAVQIQADTYLIQQVQRVESIYEWDAVQSTLRSDQMVVLHHTDNHGTYALIVEKSTPKLSVYDIALQDHSIDDVISNVAQTEKAPLSITPQLLTHPEVRAIPYMSIEKMSEVLQIYFASPQKPIDHSLYSDFEKVLAGAGLSGKDFASVIQIAQEEDIPIQSLFRKFASPPVGSKEISTSSDTMRIALRGFIDRHHLAPTIAKENIHILARLGYASNDLELRMSNLGLTPDIIANIYSKQPGVYVDEDRQMLYLVEGTSTVDQRTLGTVLQFEAANDPDAVEYRTLKFTQKIFTLSEEQRTQYCKGPFFPSIFFGSSVSCTIRQTSHEPPQRLYYSR